MASRIYSQGYRRKAQHAYGGRTGTWRRHVVTTNVPRAYDVALADFDGAGLLDVAVAGYISNLVTWHKNPGLGGWKNEWPRYVIDDDIVEVRTIHAIDMNGNGWSDLLCAGVGAREINSDPHGSQVVWYENPGWPESQPWKKHVIDRESRVPIHGHPVDMTGDGKIDVVMAFGQIGTNSPVHAHEIVWYENLGGGMKWKKHAIGKLPYAFEAVAADLDGDGQMEVVASAWALGNQVVWFKHDGNPRGSWTMHTIRKNWPAANPVIVADLTGDGWMDVIAVADDGSRRVAGANELRWWRNDGAHA